MIIVIINLLSLLGCETPSQPSNSHVAFTNTTINSTAEYSCTVGYQLIGNSTRVCQSDGKWSGSVPFCQSKWHPWQLAHFLFYSNSLFWQLWIAVNFLSQVIQLVYLYHMVVVQPTTALQHIPVSSLTNWWVTTLKEHVVVMDNGQEWNHIVKVM